VYDKLTETHPELDVHALYYEPGVGFMGVWDNGVDRAYSMEGFLTGGSKDPFWKTEDGIELDEQFDIVESLQESEEQETEASRMVRELVVDRKAQNMEQA